MDSCSQLACVDRRAVRQEIEKKTLIVYEIFGGTIFNRRLLGLSSRWPVEEENDAPRRSTLRRKEITRYLLFGLEIVPNNNLKELVFNIKGCRKWVFHRSWSMDFKIKRNMLGIINKEKY